MKFFKSNKGFTLVELLVVTLLLTVVAVISSDMIITLTSTSAKVQNKISVEEEYSFLNAKLVKLIQDAYDVSVVGGNLNIVYPEKVYKLSLAQNTLILDNLELSSVEIGKNNSYSVSVRGTNPKIVELNFKISKDYGNQRLEASTDFKRIITVNKTY